METIKLGNKVRVSDPCYGTDCWCAGTVENVKPGDYVVDVEYMDGYVNRVAKLTIIHSDYINKDISFTETAPIDVGVDSGQAGFYDVEYYNKYHKSQDEMKHVDESWYTDVCDLTSSYNGKGYGTKDDKCVVSGSGYGDGSYECKLAFNDEGEIIALSLDFIEEYYEDDEDEYVEDEEDGDDL